MRGAISDINQTGVVTATGQTDIALACDLRTAIIIRPTFRAIHPEHTLVKLFNRHAFVDAERPQTPALVVGNGRPVNRHDFSALLEGQLVQGCGCWHISQRDLSNCD
jgi:hypothetical protein